MHGKLLGRVFCRQMKEGWEDGFSVSTVQKSCCLSHQIHDQFEGGINGHITVQLLEFYRCSWGGGVLVSTALMYLLLARVTLQKLPVETSFRPFLGLLTAITKVGSGIILFFHTFVFNGSVSSSLNYLLVIFNFYECTLSPQVVSNSFRSFTSEVGIDL